MKNVEFSLWDAVHEHKRGISHEAANDSTTVSNCVGGASDDSLVHASSRTCSSATEQRLSFLALFS